MYCTMMVCKADLPKVRAWFAAYEVSYEISHASGDLWFVTYRITNELHLKFLEWFSREMEG